MPSALPRASVETFGVLNGSLGRASLVDADYLQDLEKHQEYFDEDRTELAETIRNGDGDTDQDLVASLASKIMKKVAETMPQAQTAKVSVVRPKSPLLKKVLTDGEDPVHVKKGKHVYQSEHSRPVYESNFSNPNMKLYAASDAGLCNFVDELSSETNDIRFTTFPRKNDMAPQTIGYANRWKNVEALGPGPNYNPPSTLKKQGFHIGTYRKDINDFANSGPDAGVSNMLLGGYRDLKPLKSTFSKAKRFNQLKEDSTALLHPEDSKRAYYMDRLLVQLVPTPSRRKKNKKAPPAPSESELSGTFATSPSKLADGSSGDQLDLAPDSGSKLVDSQLERQDVSLVRETTNTTALLQRSVGAGSSTASTSSSPGTLMHPIRDFRGAPSDTKRDDWQLGLRYYNGRRGAKGELTRHLREYPTNQSHGKIKQMKEAYTSGRAGEKRKNESSQQHRKKASAHQRTKGTKREKVNMVFLKL